MSTAQPPTPAPSSQQSTPQTAQPTSQPEPKKQVNVRLPRFNPLGILTAPFRIFSFVGNTSAIIVLIGAILILSALVGVRIKVLGILDALDKELYAIEDSTLEGTIRVTEGVTVGTVLPVGEVIQNLNGIPDSLPINTEIDLDTSSIINTDLDLVTQIPINTTATSSIEIPPLGNLEMISIPIITTPTIDTTIPLNTSIPIDSTVPLEFDIPLSEELQIALDEDLDLETTLPIYTEIPISLDISETNMGPRFTEWHRIINLARQLLLSPEKTKADLR